VSADTVRLCLLRLLGFDRSGDRYKGVDSGKVCGFERAIHLEELTGGETTRKQRLQSGATIFFDFVFKPRDFDLAYMARGFVPLRKTHSVLIGNAKAGF